MNKKELSLIEEEYGKEKQKLKETFQKQKEDIGKKISNKEQKEIAFQELDLKEREKFLVLSDRYIEEKSKKTAFLDRVIKTIKVLKPNDVMEEEDYLFLKEKGLEEFVEEFLFLE